MTPNRTVSTASALTAIWLVAAAATARAQDSALPAGFKTQPLVKSGQTRDKQPLIYPKTDNPEIISVIGIIEPGGRTPLHEHPVPIYVYILEGEWNCRVTGDSRINTKPARHTSRLSITSKSRS